MILPYDHNRVELHEYIDADDYVNASWIGGAEKLIAAQGPLPTTVVHFLQMIVEREVDLVVMLGPNVEKDTNGTETSIKEAFRFYVDKRLGGRVSQMSTLLNKPQ